MSKIGVIGHNGVVGGAIYKALNADYGLSLNEGSYEEMANADVVFVAVPTPQSPDGSVDMGILDSVVDSLNKNSIKKQVVVIKSTVLPYTNQRLSLQYPNMSFVSSPEFLTEASPLQDFLNPDRVLVGTNSKEDFALVVGVYKRVLSRNKVYLRCIPVEAELIKYAANCFLAMKVIFFNELKEVCDKIGAGFATTSLGVSLDKRIGTSHTRVSKEGGYSGMCFPKDTIGFLKFAESIGVDPSLIRATVKKNKEIRNEN